MLWKCIQICHEKFNAKMLWVNALKMPCKNAEQKCNDILDHVKYLWFRNYDPEVSLLNHSCFTCDQIHENNCNEFGHTLLLHKSDLDAQQTRLSPMRLHPGNTKGGSIIVQLTSCLTCLDLSVLQRKIVIQLIPNQTNRRSTVQWYFPI